MPEFLSFVRRWFDETFAEATRPQREGWEAIASGRDTLIVAPTGSGKTLAAFLWALDPLHRLGLERRLEDRVYVVYVSPLRALNNDIEKNLRAPLQGIRDKAAAAGEPLSEIRVAVRTGDTLAHVRQAMVRRPPRQRIYQSRHHSSRCAKRLVRSVSQYLQKNPPPDGCRSRHPRRYLFHRMVIIITYPHPHCRIPSPSHRPVIPLVISRPGFDRNASAPNMNQ